MISVQTIVLSLESSQIRRNHNWLRSLSFFFSQPLNELLPIVITRVLFVPDIEAYLQRIAEIEEGYARSLTFSDVFSSASNVNGNTSIFDLSEWLGKKRYPLLRDSVAITRSREERADERPPKISLADSKHEPPDESRLKHSQRRILSLIEPDLWDAAGWRGVSVICYPDYPPFLALMFENREPARRIFKNWQKEIGKIDKEHLLRISVLTGIDITNPFAYSLSISTNLDVALKGLEGETAITMSRSKKMDSAQQNTMRDFHRFREQYGCYYLAPAAMPINATTPELLSDLRILKKDIITRPAWEVGVNDQDITALRDDDEPVIPDGIDNPPIREALEWLRAKRRK